MLQFCVIIWHIINDNNNIYINNFSYSEYINEYNSLQD